jgi:hypothetical protein
MLSSKYVLRTSISTSKCLKINKCYIYTKSELNLGGKQKWGFNRRRRKNNGRCYPQQKEIRISQITKQ